MDLFSRRMISDLYGNPHSENAPARLSGEAVDRVRARTLRFLGADPEHFDLVFVANATAGVKLVADAFRDLAEKSRAQRFWYGFHKDAHTSLVGVRELTYGCHDCFESDDEVEAWLDAPASGLASTYPPGELGLFAYPGVSHTRCTLPLPPLSAVPSRCTPAMLCLWRAGLRMPPKLAPRTPAPGNY